MLIIGIAGGTGSGKTTVVNQIMNELPADEVCVISQDSYYKATDNLTYDERVKINFDHPRAIDFELLIQHISDLKNHAFENQCFFSSRDGGSRLASMAPRTAQQLLRASRSKSPTRATSRCGMG